MPKTITSQYEFIYIPPLFKVESPMQTAIRHIPFEWSITTLLAQYALSRLIKSGNVPVYRTVYLVVEVPERPYPWKRFNAEIYSMSLF